MAEKWGIGDDGDREDAVDRASRDELDELIGCLDDIDDKLLDEWLTGAESQRQPPSREYIAITCLTMARESGKAKRGLYKKDDG